MKNKNIIRPARVTLLILLIPLAGTLFVDGFNWGIADFIVIGALIFGTGLLIELITMKIKNSTLRLAIIIAIILALFYIIAELAVGIFTNLGS